MATNTLFFKENLRILGQVYKHEREEQGYSLRGVARSARVAHTVVSDIENGKTCPNIETLQLLYETLAIKFCTSDEFLTNMKQTMEQLMDATYYRNNENITAYLSVLNAHHKRLRYSPLRIDFLLIRALGTVEKLECEKPCEDFFLLEAYQNHLSAEQIILYSLTKGIYLYKTAKFDDAERSFKKVLSLTNNDRYKAMTLYYMAKISDYHYHNHPSYNRAKEASVIFTYHQNAQRKLVTDLLLVKKTIEIAYFDEAENIFKNLEHIFRLNHQNMSYKKVYLLMKSYFAFVKNEYDEALNLIQDLDLTYPLDLFYKAYLLYVTNQKEETINVLTNLINMNVVDRQKRFVASGYLFLDYLGYEHIDASALEHAADVIAHQPYNFKYVYMHYFVYDLLMSFYDKRNRTKAMADASKKWIKVAKKRDFYETKLT